jgi:hypothetical protein
MGPVTAHDNDTEVAAFLADVRATYVSEPEEAIASRHVAAIAHEAALVLGRRTAQPSWRRTMRNRFLRPVATLGAATLAAILATAGLAVAGVTLPDPAQNAFNKVGISLPNQAGGENQSGEHSRSDAVRSIIEATPPSERGCAFGHSVAEAAKKSSLPPQAQGACDKGENDGAADENSSSSHSQFGHDTAERAKSLKDATVDQRKSFGQQTSDQAQQLGSSQSGNAGAEQRSQTPAAGDTTGVPEGTTTGPPEGTRGPPDNAGAPDDTPGGAPDGTPSGRP